MIFMVPVQEITYSIHFFTFEDVRNESYLSGIMEIEKEIKQTVRFASEHQKMVVNIMYTASWLHMQHTRYLKPLDLTPQQFNLLRILRGKHPDPATINMLIDRMIDKSSNASRLVERLDAKGFVSKKTNKKDKRSVLVSITPSGLETLLEADAVIRKMEGDLDTLNHDEAATINKLLDKLRD
jgi:DNA-binding MarR family transcriptional regulator